LIGWTAISSGISQKGLAQVSSIDELKPIIDRVLKENDDKINFSRRG